MKHEIKYFTQQLILGNHFVKDKLNNFSYTFYILGHANNHEQRQNDIYLVRNLCHLHLLSLQLEHIQKQNLLLFRSNAHTYPHTITHVFSYNSLQSKEKNKDIFTLLGVRFKQRIKDHENDLPLSLQFSYVQIRTNLMIQIVLVKSKFN